MSKETFKEFVKKNIHLHSAVRQNKTTWQKLYETYDIYGEESVIWDSYKETLKQDSKSIGTGSGGVKDLFSMMKTIDVEAVQKGIDGVQKAIGMVQDLGIGKGSNTGSNYEARPIYKKFDD